MKLVNILNVGRIPWLHVDGPIFGYLITDGLLSLISKDPAVIVQLTTPDEAKKAKAEYEASLKKKEEIADQFSMADNFEIKTEKIASEEHPTIEKKVEKTSEDDEIDNILGDMNINSSDDGFFSDAKPVEKPEVERYTKEQLLAMTKRQMKTILRERGYTEGPNAGKYHDTVEMLIEKVLRTQ